MKPERRFVNTSVPNLKEGDRVMYLGGTMNITGSPYLHKEENTYSVACRRDEKEAAERPDQQVDEITHLYGDHYSYYSKIVD